MAANVAGSFVSRLFGNRGREAVEAPVAAKEAYSLSPSAFALSAAFLFYWPDYVGTQGAFDASAEEDVRE